MNNYSLSENFNRINDKFIILCKKFKNIKEKLNENNFDFNENNLNIILDVSKNLNVLEFKINDLYEIILNTINEDELTSDDRLILRENKINNMVNKIFIPYMIYLKICLENSNI